MFAFARRLPARLLRARLQRLLALATLSLALLAGPAHAAPPFVSGETLPGTEVWQSDYENGFASWNAGIHEVRPDRPAITDAGYSNGSCSRGSFSGEDRLRIVTSPVRQGSHAARFVVYNGDRPICASGNRVQHLRSSTNESEGDESYYKWSSMLAADFPYITGTYQLIVQWHGASGANGTQAPVRVDLHGDTIRFITVENDPGGNQWQTHWTAPISRGRWHDFVAHIRWSYNRSVGFVELWHRLEGETNYTLVVPRTYRRTLVYGPSGEYANSGVYFVPGYYRGQNAGPPGVVYHDGWIQTRVTPGSTGSSPPPPPPPSGQAPFNTALPTISGMAQQGRQLTATNGSWSNSPTSYTRQWRRCSSAGTNCAAISGATSSTYTATASDVGSRLQVAVTATNSTGSSTSTSASTAVVTAASGTPPPPPPAPSGQGFAVTSTIAEGQTLSGTVGWRATISGTTTSNISQVEFLVDWTRVLIEAKSPYGDTPGFFDTRTLQDGAHAFVVRATARDGTVATGTVNAIVANGSGEGTASPPPPPPPPPPSGGGADTPSAQISSTVTDSGCTGCSFSAAGSELEATIAGGADSVDTAYGVVDLGSTGWDGRVWTRDVIRVPASSQLPANLSVYQVRDVNDSLVYELYVSREDGTIRLWSPAGGLRSSSINMSAGMTADPGRRVEVSALRNESVVVRVDGVDRITVNGLSGASTQNQRFIRAGIDHYDTNTTAETIRAYHSMLGATTGGWLESRTSPLTSALLKTRTHKARASATRAAKAKTKAAKASQAERTKAKDAKATRITKKRVKVAAAGRPAKVALSATKAAATKLAVDISKRPQALPGGRIAVQGLASPGAAVTIVVRDANGRILGLGRSKASQRGFFFEPVSLRAWKGQGFLQVTASVVGTNDMRRTSFGTSLSKAERTRLGSD